MINNCWFLLRITVHFCSYWPVLTKIKSYEAVSTIDYLHWFQLLATMITIYIYLQLFTTIIDYLQLLINYYYQLSSAIISYTRLFIAIINHYWLLATLSIRPREDIHSNQPTDTSYPSVLVWWSEAYGDCRRWIMENGEGKVRAATSSDITKQL